MTNSKQTYQEMTSTIQKTLEAIGYITYEIWHFDNCMTQIAVIKQDSEITINEVASALENTIDRNFFEARWISENGEVYINTWKFWNRKAA